MSATTVRKLLRNATVATLATADTATGHPYASLVEVATLPDARPLLLLSGLARHTRNLKQDPRASLLVDRRQHHHAATLASERTTLLCRAQPIDAAIAAPRYLARLPDAETYVGFADFSFWVLEPLQAHLIAGFGRICEVPGEDLKLSDQDALELAAQEPEILSKVNTLATARGLPRRAVGLDLEGIDHVGPDGLCRSDLTPILECRKKYINSIIYELGAST